MTRSLRFVFCVAAAALAYIAAPHADAPHVYAIKGARLVTAAGAPIASGTIVLRNGLIEAVGANVAAPADAMVIEGAGLSVYPGLIDMGNGAGLDAQAPVVPGVFRTLEDAEWWKRGVILRPELEAAKVVRPDGRNSARLAPVGVTSVLATPSVGLFKGQSALVNVTAPEDEPQVGAVADPRKGLQIVRTPVALHVALGGGGGRGAGYPVSLLGTIAFVRQSFLDAQYQHLEQQRYARVKTGVTRPTYDPSLDAIQPALARALPVAFEADLSREILRALDVAKEFNLDPVITGAREADQVIPDLKARNARVIFSLDFPSRPRALSREGFKSFCLFSIVIGAIIYPIFGCWVWGGGWLAQLGYRAGLGHGVVDYAGSGVVHLQGGSLALITALMIGPRIGKYAADGKVNPILPHDIPMVQVGTFILAFGWFGFNAGSSLAGGDGRIGIVAANTMIAGMSATLSGVAYMWARYGKPDPSMMCNSMLAGLVAITAPCAFVTPISAFIIGAIAGVLVVVSVFFFDKLKIDDPVGAISVHGVNGAFGVLAVGLFADGSYGQGWNGVGATEYLGTKGGALMGVTGLFYGDSKQFIAQIVEVVVGATWNIVLGGVAFYIIGKLLGSNRVSAAVEIAGLDMPEMGMPAYPEWFPPTPVESVPATEISAAKAAIPALSNS